MKFKQATFRKARKLKKIRVKKPPKFIDFFPNIEGTLPEKVVYNALVALQIPFQFQYYLPVEYAPWVDTFRPDFVLPDYKIVIEVLGVYWHSSEKQREKDALRFAILEANGWKVIYWWDYEILQIPGIFQLLKEVPEFNPPKITGPPYPITWDYPSDVQRVRDFFAKFWHPEKVKWKT